MPPCGKEVKVPESTRIFLIRHGQTAWNRDVRFRGRTDLPLDETGLAQAEALARRLLNHPIAAVYSSPLRRAVQTALPIARSHGLEVQPLDGFLDINYGKWQGLTPAQVAELYPDLYKKWLEAPHLVDIPGGENLKTVRERALNALYQVIEKHPGQAVVVVAHQVVNKVLLCAVLNISNAFFWHIEQDNGCLNIIEYDERGFNLVLLNDTCHLRE